MALLAVFIAGTIIGILAVLIINRSYLNKSNVLQAEASPFTEAEIIKLLNDNGYKITGRRKQLPIITMVGDKSHFGNVIVDFEAEKNNKKYLVKVLENPEPTDLLTRQQMVELAYISKSHSLLLVNAGKKELLNISFKLPSMEKDLFLALFLPIFIISVVIGIIAILIQLKLF
ncbi:MAG: hypothetical protein FD145_392 [Candidatus Saganbacteria bacterium]|uniref:Uncharacterized protein n=1 Tax=Candidatus Saganbacteria bacterium TaxID=2575572 RepID=A0A833L1W9_UNCSA|nr:MAG: hypothetical protein FD145_392 [Candidatus Saganbacteria bacterium]